MDSSQVNGVILRVKWYLKLKVISVVFRGISSFTDKLSNVNMCSGSTLSLILTFTLGLDHIIILWVFDFIIGRLLGKSSELILSHD
jgi:hypothetical protein